MTLETCCTALISIVAGLAFGMLLCKLCLLLVIRMMREQVQFGFNLSPAAIVMTLILFGGIFLLTLLSNLRQIHLAKPVELLRGGEQGEREPKTKWVLAIVGLICLVAGYVMSLLTKNPLEALSMFFLAVILVIIGTYCLFTAGSIAVLKLLRKNKNYYYKSKHFISVSGMIYRMKQNAVGLSNICILSTMVLVMISTTFSIYTGMDRLLYRWYPKQISIMTREADSDTLQKTETAIDALLKQGNLNEEKSTAYTYFALSGADSNGSIAVSPNTVSASSAYDLHTAYFLSLEDYNRTTDSNEVLGDGEILLYSSRGNSLKTFSILGQTYTVRRQISEFPSTGDAAGNIAPYYYIVLPEKEFSALNQLQKTQFGDSASRLVSYCAFDVSAGDSEQIALRDQIASALPNAKVETRAGNRAGIYAAYGGFFFLGVFLGALFLMATVLIMYYKQVSEGYDDKGRFLILQKVGMSREEVRKSIHSQVLSVFFLPLIVAALHTAAAFPMTTCMMTLFGLTDTALFALCTLGCFVIFGIFYALVYWATARAYYKIVEK